MQGVYESEVYKIIMKPKHSGYNVPLHCVQKALVHANIKRVRSPVFESHSRILIAWTDSYLGLSLQM